MDPDLFVRTYGIEALRQCLAEAIDLDVWIARENLRDAVRRKCERIANEIDDARTVRGLRPLRSASSRGSSPLRVR